MGTATAAPVLAVGPVMGVGVSTAIAERGDILGTETRAPGSTITACGG
jgi:hypothetical protein